MEAKDEEENRKEDYFVKATLTFDGIEINNVPCKIYLPERIVEKPHLTLKPCESDANKIMKAHKIAFKAVIYASDNTVQTIFEAPEIYCSKCFTTVWGKDFSESTMPAEPQDLHVIHPLNNYEGEEKTHIEFWVSPNKFLAPFLISSSSYTGEVNCRRVKNFHFTINDGVKITFDKHFKSKTSRNGDFVQWSFLVACAELDVHASDIEKINNTLLQHINDFLLVAGFASRERTACLGWTASDKTSLTTFYRGNYTFPEEDDNNSSLDDGVIDIKDFERFMNVGYHEFERFDNKLALRNALYPILQFSPQTIDTSFLHIFSGLETLVLDFRRKENLEFILPPVSWDVMRKYLQECIRKSNEPKLDKEQRASIYCKLGELNRVSLREAFDIFCTKYDIDLLDLWPVFGKNGLVGLADIRNKLIHGDPFPHNLYGALIVAKEHLTYTLERVLVRVLGWKISETKINPSYLEMHFNAIKDLPAEQARVTEYLTGQNQ